MKRMYIQIEILFEKLTDIATKVLGNPITFIVALILVGVWWANTLFRSGDVYQDIRDLIFGFTFLSLFLIQKSSNRFSSAIHLKLNELIASHEQADNKVIETSEKTEEEIRKQAESYSESSINLDVDKPDEKFE